jgi:hypothetical protein
MSVIDRQWADEIGGRGVRRLRRQRVRAVIAYVHDRSPHAGSPIASSEVDSPVQRAAISHDGADGERILR